MPTFRAEYAVFRQGQEEPEIHYHRFKAAGDRFAIVCAQNHIRLKKYSNINIEKVELDGLCEMIPDDLIERTERKRLLPLTITKDYP